MCLNPLGDVVFVTTFCGELALVATTAISPAMSAQKGMLSLNATMTIRESVTVHPTSPPGSNNPNGYANCSIDYSYRPSNDTKTFSHADPEVKTCSLLHSRKHRTYCDFSLDQLDRMLRLETQYAPDAEPVHSRQ